MTFKENDDYEKTYKFHKTVWRKIDTIHQLKLFLLKHNDTIESNHTSSTLEFILYNKGFITDLLYNKIKKISTKVHKVFMYNNGSVYYTVVFVNNGFWNIIYKGKFITGNDIIHCVDTCWKLYKNNFNNKPVKFVII